MGDRRQSSTDEVPNSRLFVIGSKALAEKDFREAFEGFGHIEEIWVVKDRVSGENKGVTYVKFSKTSEAAKALEAMNGTCIGKVNRSIKVMIASSRDQGSKRDSNEEEKILRLFVKVPKSMTETELRDAFKEYGTIDYASLIRDRSTNESKGFAYVKYFKFSEAAVAFEQCDRSFKAVFAEPRKKTPQNEEKFSNFEHYGQYGSNNGNTLLPLPDTHTSDNFTKLSVIVSPMVNQDQMWKLFDIVPGLDYCQLRLEGRPRPSRGICSVVYQNPKWAAHAKEKLHGFEYPPGCRLIVRSDYDGPTQNYSDKPSSNSSLDMNNKSEIMRLAETIAHASSLIKAAGLPVDLHSKLGLFSGNSKNVESLCNVPLPDPKPLANIDAEMAARCFIVCSPSPPSNSILKDVFCRFGDLIDVYMLPNKSCGYAKYSSREAAQNAIDRLHGAEICGCRLKVIEAEERSDNNRKRPRIDANPY